MIDDSSYLVIGLEKFHQDLHLLRQQAKANPAVYRDLYRSVLREIERLRTGSTDGHHALGYEAGKGDLRDCVVGYVQSDPEQKADYRLVFREIGPGVPGEVPRRELLAIKPRRGSNNIYAHVCARLNRHPADRQPGLDRFGDRSADSGGSQASRQAELDTKRAIAHAWTGQQPLVSSRPLTLSASSRSLSLGASSQSPGLGTGPSRSYAEAAGMPRAGPRGSPGPPRPINARPGPTGWPTRHTKSPDTKSPA